MYGLQQMHMDLPTILGTFPKHVVLRLDPTVYPAYTPRSDIDLLLEQHGLEAAVRAVQAAVPPGMHVDVHTLRAGQHLHVDLMEASGLHFRFDLYTALPYMQFTLHPEVYEQVLAHREWRDGAWVPCRADDLALRYAEYVEYADMRPDKIKHRQYTETHGADVNFYRVQKGDQDCLLGYRPRAPERFAIILWGHGLAHLCDTLELLHQHVEACQVLHVRKVELPDLAAFLQLVYAQDLGPGTTALHGHIRDKTRYLAGVPKTCMFVLLRKPHARMKGEFDQDLVDFKWAVRRRFNPRSDTQPAVPPLPQGITHHHVIHAMDRLHECDPVCRHLTGHPGAYFEHRCIHGAQLPYHLALSPTAFRAMRLHASQLCASLQGTGLVPLAQTPHMAFLQGQEAPYTAYYQERAGMTLVDGHSPACFRALAKRFSVHTYRRTPVFHIVVQPEGEHMWRILDGVHRSALMVHGNSSAAIPVWCMP
jgi:hypothetical protein